METEEKTVPFARFQESVAANQEIKSKYAAAQARVAELESLNQGNWKEKYEAEVQAHSASKEGFTRSSTLLRAGVTDESDQSLVLWKYGQLDAESRPPLAEFLSTSAKTDRHLASLFASTTTNQVNGVGDAGVTGADSATTAETTGAPPVGTNAGVQPNPPNIQTTARSVVQMTPEQYEAARAELLATGGSIL